MSVVKKIQGDERERERGGGGGGGCTVVDLVDFLLECISLSKSMSHIMGGPKVKFPRPDETGPMGPKAIWDWSHGPKAIWDRSQGHMGPVPWVPWHDGTIWDWSH